MLLPWCDGHRRSQAPKVAKIIERSRTTEEKALKEIGILKKMDCPCIVKLYQCFVNARFIYLIFEPFGGREVHSPLLEVQGCTLRNMRAVFKQIFIGLTHLHAKKIFHCNLVPEHILIAEAGEEVSVKIIGFGNAVNMESKKKEGHNEEPGQLSKEQKINVIW